MMKRVTACREPPVYKTEGRLGNTDMLCYVSSTANRSLDKLQGIYEYSTVVGKFCVCRQGGYVALVTDSMLDHM